MTDNSTSSLLDLPPSSQQSESLASVSSSESSDSESGSDAEAEWQESLKQLELLLSMVVVPFMGKYIGRRCAFWAWAKYMTWNYPVEIVMTSKAAFDATGLVAAAAPL